MVITIGMRITVLRNKLTIRRLIDGPSSILQVAATGAIGATGAVAPGRVVDVAHDDVIASVTTPIGTECKYAYLPTDTSSYIDETNMADSLHFLALIY